MSHTVTITKFPDETSDDVEYEFGGEHDSRCETYIECQKDWHRHPKSEYIREVEAEWSSKRAGYHAYIDGMWCVPNGCALSYVFEGYTPEETLEGRELGTYNVSCNWDGGGWELEVLDRVPSDSGYAS